MAVTYLQILTLISILSMQSLVAQAPTVPTRVIPKTNLMVIENLEQPTAGEAIFLAQMIEDEEFIDVDINGTRAIIIVDRKPEKKKMPNLLQGIKAYVSDIKDAVTPGLGVIGKLVGETDVQKHNREQKEAEQSLYLFQAAQNKSTLATGQVLTAMLMASQLDPEIKQELLGIAKRYLMAFEKVQMDAKGSYISDPENVMPEIQYVQDGLQTAILSLENQIPYEVLQNHPDLRHFLATNNIGEWSQLFQTQHPIKVEKGSDGGDIISIWYENRWQPWESVQQHLLQSDSYALKDHVFVEKGFVPGSVTGTINALRQDPRPDFKYYYEENEGRLPEHRWIRLTDADGTIYSVGWLSKGRKDLPDALHSWTSYLLSPIYGSEQIALGAVVSPDPAELIPDQQVQHTRHEITKAKFDEIMAFLKTYQGNPDACYQGSEKGSQGTCDPAQFVETVREIIGIK